VTNSLSCSRGAPLFRVDRTFFDAEDVAPVLGTSYFVPDHYSYRVRIRRTSRCSAVPVKQCPGEARYWGEMRAGVRAATGSHRRQSR
jgi:hypothetical protein